MSSTSLVMDKSIYTRASKQAKKDKLSVSAVARILLDDYASGYISIGVRTSSHPQVSLVDVDDDTQKLIDSVVSKWRKKSNS